MRAKFTPTLILSIFLLITVGSVSAQYVYGTCSAIGNGNWNVASNWGNCVGTPTSSGDSASIGSFDIVITGNEQAQSLSVSQFGSLFIDCDASLTVAQGLGGNSFGIITNHGIFTVISDFFQIFAPGIFFNSGTFTNVVTIEGGQIIQISSICPQVVGGTLVPVDTLSLLVAGTQANIQANIGWLSLAIVGIIAAGAGIALKKRSEKNNEN